MQPTRFTLGAIAAALLALAPALPSPTPAHAADVRPPALDLSAYKGKIVYLDFWASWCIPCRQSFPYMRELMLRYGGAHFTVVAVNLDHDRSHARAFIDHFNPNFPVVFDPKGRIAKAYKVEDMPTSVLIGPDGKVRFTHQGFFPEREQTYNRQIAELLNEKD
jgi:cytochrome c biogenesis protein CcmG/thiol:disulfide interchange protein DsbE